MSLPDLPFEKITVTASVGSSEETMVKGRLPLNSVGVGRWGIGHGSHKHLEVRPAGHGDQVVMGREGDIARAVCY